jgi:hypothetical protein
MIDHFDWAGGREAMIRFGPGAGPAVVLALPFWEEANRVRTFAVRILRLLADRGIAGALPDLPGQGESAVPTEYAMLAGWRAAFAAAVDHVAASRPVHGVAIRSGALVDTQASLTSRWHLAPASGEAQLRELFRASAATGAPIEIDLANHDDEGGPVLMMGNRVARPLLRDIAVANPIREGAVRVVRLATDPAVADWKVEGPALWRLAEPGDDSALAALLATDIAEWIERCAS